MVEIVQPCHRTLHHIIIIRNTTDYFQVLPLLCPSITRIHKTMLVGTFSISRYYQTIKHRARLSWRRETQCPLPPPISSSTIHFPYLTFPYYACIQSKRIRQLSSRLTETSSDCFEISTLPRFVAFYSRTLWPIERKAIIKEVNPPSVRNARQTNPLFNGLIRFLPQGCLVADWEKWGSPTRSYVISLTKRGAAIVPIYWTGGNLIDV